MAQLLKNDRVTAQDHFQDTRHIEFSLGDSGLTYQPGALLAIMPHQDASAVAAFCRRVDLDPASWVSIEPEQELTNGHSPSMKVTQASLHEDL